MHKRVIALKNEIFKIRGSQWYNFRKHFFFIIMINLNRKKINYLIEKYKFASIS